MLKPRDKTDEESALYRRMARAIRFLTDHYSEQPSLAAAAEVAALSPDHFQRQFTRFAGVSPKNFVANLTLEHAKRLLSEGSSVLDAAYAAGLSGSSRLHDLCLKIETMTPGTYAKGGAGLSLGYGFHDSLFGVSLFVVSEHGLCGLGFGDEGEEETMLADMRARWRKAAFVHDPERTRAIAEMVFSRRGEVPIQLYGTPWQVKVWQALLAIPEGKVTTYKTIAERVCTARASRAVGAAVGQNPISLLIPCHRVLASSGALTGYHWGLPRKRAMLAHEAARIAEG